MSNLDLSRNTVEDEQLSKGAYEQTQKERDDLPESDVRHVNLNVPSGVATVFGALPAILALRQEAEKVEEVVAPTVFDHMEKYTLALVYATAQNSVSFDPPDDLQPLNEEGMGLRNTLSADVNALVQRGFIVKDTLKNYKGTFGYKIVALDLQILVSVLRNNLSVIEGKCAVSAQELDHAERLSFRILRIVGLREQAEAASAATANQRDRAFTLFVRCYDQIQRVVYFLRWNEDDADTIAPSLYPSRPRKSQRGTETEPVATQPATAATTTTSTPTASPSASVDPTGNGPFVQ